MQTEKSNIIRRKIETGAVYAVVGETGGDASKRVTAATSRVLTEHFKIKSTVNCASEMPGSLGVLLEKNGENRRGFRFQVEGEADCVVLMDPAAIMTAATWAHEGIIPDELAAPTTKISTIDQRLASMLASEMVNAILADEDDEIVDAEDKSVDLAEIGADASRFILGDETLSATAIELEASTMDGAGLGTITLLLPDALLTQNDEDDEALAQKLAARNWANNMAKMVSGTPISAKAIIATQDISFRALSNLKPGQVISLRGASLDAVTLQPENDIEGHSLALGAVRSFDGLRTMQISAVGTKETAPR